MSPTKMADPMQPMPGSKGATESAAVLAGQRGGIVLAVMLNPPSASSGARSLGAVRRAASVLGFDDCDVANLFVEPTPTMIELNSAIGDDSEWSDLRQRLVCQLAGADGVLAAWGVAGASGAFRLERRRRASWLLNQAARTGHDHIWMVGGEPRHPSRWHQFVADKHGRTAGGTFEERIGQVLVRVRTADAARSAHYY